MEKMGCDGTFTVIGSRNTSLLKFGMIAFAYDGFSKDGPRRIPPVRFAFASNKNDTIVCMNAEGHTKYRKVARGSA